MKKLHPVFRKIKDDCTRFWFPVLLALCYLAISSYLFQTPCPIAILFHFPCPGCGMTRACTALLQGSPATAFQYNAMIFFWIPLALYFLGFRYFFQKEPPLFLPVCVALGGITIAYYTFRLLSGSAFALVA